MAMTKRSPSRSLGSHSTIISVLAALQGNKQKTACEKQGGEKSQEGFQTFRTLGDLDVQGRADQGHQRGVEVHRVVIGDGKIHTKQPLHRRQSREKSEPSHKWCLCVGRISIMTKGRWVWEGLYEGISTVS